MNNMTMESSVDTMENNNKCNPSIAVEMANDTKAGTERTDYTDNSSEGSDEQAIRKQEPCSSVTKRSVYCILAFLVLLVVVTVCVILAKNSKCNEPPSNKEPDPDYNYLDPGSDNNDNGSSTIGEDPGRNNSSTIPDYNYPIPDDNTDSLLNSTFCDSTGDFCWVQVGNTLSATNIPGVDDDFGSIVSISDDGSRVLVSAPSLDHEGNLGAGLIRIYDLDSNDHVWKQWGNDIVGEAINEGIVGVMSGNGQRIAVLSRVTDYQDKDISIYDINDLQPVKLGSTLRSTTEYWDFVSVHLDREGNTVVVGSPQIPEGSMQVYAYDGNDWAKRGQEIIGSSSQDERLGAKVALSDDASILATSSYFLGNVRGSAKIFRFENATWVLSKMVTDKNAYAYFGEKFALASSGHYFAASSYDSTVGLSRVSVYSVESGKVAEDIRSSSDRETIVSLALSSDGTRLAVSRQFGGVNTDRAYLYVYDLRNGASWEQVGGTISFESYSDMFYSGMDMSPDGSHVIVGGTRQNLNGHSMVFRLRGLA